ncbi:hypothetical protein EV359DRAFT_64789 [Lentinula novae-zelandiae]|nr:hypothetical protein EV359DRAFT_64789 [Lentinula novae-zelandiae]
MRFADILGELFDPVILLETRPERRHHRVWTPTFHSLTSVTVFLEWIKSVWTDNDNVGRSASAGAEGEEGEEEDPDRVGNRVLNDEEDDMYGMGLPGVHGQMDLHRVVGLTTGNALYVMKAGVLTRFNEQRLCASRSSFLDQRNLLTRIEYRLIPFLGNAVLDNQFLWGIIMALLASAKFRGDITFGFLMRLFSSFLGGGYLNVLKVVNPFGQSGFPCRNRSKRLNSIGSLEDYVLSTNFAQTDIRAEVVELGQGFSFVLFVWGVGDEDRGPGEFVLGEVFFEGLLVFEGFGIDENLDSWTTKEYMCDSQDRIGVICISITGLISLLAILSLFVFRPLKSTTYARTHLFGYLTSLLVGNGMIASATVMSFDWIAHGGVQVGGVCTAQGALKQAGNLATALWSFIIALHLFNILFLRSPASMRWFWVATISGWGVVAGIVAIGPMVIQQTKQRGRYFGITGLGIGWSVGLRMGIEMNRGNLILVNVHDDHTPSSSAKSLDDDHKVSDPDNDSDNDNTTKSIKSTCKWRFQHVPSSDSWQLVFSRDLIDTAMLRFAGRMVWFPISYILLLLPSGIAGLSAARGHPVSPGAEVFVGVTYNLIGLTTVLLLHTTRHLYPSSADLSNIPGFETKRCNHAFVQLMETGGVTLDLCSGGGRRFLDEATEFFQHLNYFDDIEYRLVVFTDPAYPETGGDVSGFVGLWSLWVFGGSSEGMWEVGRDVGEG